MAKKITLLDGAVGTGLWEIAEKNGVNKVPVWIYNLEHPEYVTALHRAYLDAGADLILTNTFGANAPSVARSSSYDPDTVVSAGARLAVRAAKEAGKRSALAAGPLSQLMEPWGDLTEEEVRDVYLRHFESGMKEGPDCIMLQTFIDMEMMRVAAEAAKTFGVPVYCTLTFEKVGKTIMGNSVRDVIDCLTPVGIDGIGMNCSLGPDLAVPVIREFTGKTDLPILFKPNAGKPILAADGTGSASYDAETFVRDLLPALPYVDMIGGCCGSNASYISALRKAIDEFESGLLSE